MGAYKMTPSHDTAERTAALETEVSNLKEDKNDHEQRLRQLEEKKSWAAGVIAAALFLWPIIWHLITRLKGW